MSHRSPARLKRVLRVRALQLDLARADEAAAADVKGGADALAERIRALGQDVAPRAGDGSGLGLVAAAHYRARLQRSGEEAGRRVQIAAAKLDAARAVTGSAKRDHGAVEKLVERALDRDVEAARKALENAPPTVRQSLARSLLKSG